MTYIHKKPKYSEDSLLGWVAIVLLAGLYAIVLFPVIVVMELWKKVTK
jgi:hypothetical protein